MKKIILVTIAMLLIGCGNSMPSDAEIKSALDGYHKKENSGCFKFNKTIPVTLTSREQQSKLGKELEVYVSLNC